MSLALNKPKQRDPAMAKFAWQAGYGAFSVSPSAMARVCEYIGNQEAHHKQQLFQDEFRAFLQKHGVQWNDRYVWD